MKLIDDGTTTYVIGYGNPIGNMGTPLVPQKSVFKIFLTHCYWA